MQFGIEAGEILLNAGSNAITVIGSFLHGAVTDRADEVKEHCMLAVEQLTHTGRFSSHCDSVSERVYQ